MLDNSYTVWFYTPIRRTDELEGQTMNTFTTRRADQVTVDTTLVLVTPGTEYARFRTVSSVSLEGDDVVFTFFETDTTITTSRGNDVDVFNR